MLQLEKDLKSLKESALNEARVAGANLESKGYNRGVAWTCDYILNVLSKEELELDEIKRREYNKLHQTVLSMTETLEDRLVEKIKEGKTGWDDEENVAVMEGELCNKVREVMETQDIDNINFIDIIAYSMFLWKHYE